MDIESPASRVAVAYQDYIAEMVGHGFVSVEIPRRGSKGEENCAEVERWCAKHGVGLDLYFRLINGIHEDWWLKKAFNRPYLPFPIVISQFMREKALGAYRTPLKTSKDSILGGVRQILDKYPLESRKRILEAAEGWIDPSIRDDLLKEMA